MRANRYPGACVFCGNRVAKYAGYLTRKEGYWEVAHIPCYEQKQAGVVSFYFEGSGQSATRNANGRCEDAPCCGCCTF